MSEQRFTDRRTVLKGLGAGVVGGIALTGSTSASGDDRTDIYLRGHQFTPNKAKVRLDSEGGKATVRWINDEVNYYGMGYPVPHDVHIHHEGGPVVKSGLFTQVSEFDHPDLPAPVSLGPTFYEVEFREDGSDLVIEETGGKVASEDSDHNPPYELIKEYQESTIENWGGSVTLDVHCSVHSIALEADENELVTRKIENPETEPPYAFHLGFFKMDGGLMITR